MFRIWNEWYPWTSLWISRHIPSVSVISPKICCGCRLQLWPRNLPSPLLSFPIRNQRSPPRGPGTFLRKVQLWRGAAFSAVHQWGANVTIIEHLLTEIALASANQRPLATDGLAASERGVGGILARPVVCTLTLAIPKNSASRWARQCAGPRTRQTARHLRPIQGRLSPVWPTPSCPASGSGAATSCRHPTLTIERPR